MSTTDLYLDPDEVEMFITATKKRPQSFIGGDEEGDVMYGVCPYISFYVLANKDDILQKPGTDEFLPHARERMINKVIDLHHTLEKLVDRPYRKMLKNSTEVWFKVGDKRLPTDLRAEGLKAIAKDQEFWLQATDQDNTNSSARWAFDGRIPNNPRMCFITVKITFRHGWYLENKATWQTFVKMALEVLQPEQCYSGFEMGSGCGGFDGGYEAGVMERLCTEYFYGVDIDHPAKMGYHNRHGLFKDHVHWSKLDAGLRTPTWYFLLSPYWMERLALTEESLYQAFAGQDVRIQRIRHMDASMSYWIQLGELDLHPVENGIPAELAAANRLIRPVRCDHLELTSLDPWDDDPIRALTASAARAGWPASTRTANGPARRCANPRHPHKPQCSKARACQPSPASLAPKKGFGLPHTSR